MLSTKQKLPYYTSHALHLTIFLELSITIFPVYSRYPVSISCFSCASEEYEPLYSRSENIYSLANQCSSTRRVTLKYSKRKETFHVCKRCATDIFAVATAAAIEPNDRIGSGVSARVAGSRDDYDSGNMGGGRLPPAEIDFLHKADMCLSLPIQNFGQSCSLILEAHETQSYPREGMTISRRQTTCRIRQKLKMSSAALCRLNEKGQDCALGQAFAGKVQVLIRAEERISVLCVASRCRPSDSAIIHVEMSGVHSAHQKKDDNVQGLGSPIKNFIKEGIKKNKTARTMQMEMQESVEIGNVPRLKQIEGFAYRQKKKQRPSLTRLELQRYAQENVAVPVEENKAFVVAGFSDVIEKFFISYVALVSDESGWAYEVFMRAIAGLSYKPTLCTRGATKLTCLLSPQTMVTKDCHTLRRKLVLAEFMPLMERMMTDLSASEREEASSRQKFPSERSNC
uniref:Uncharacterized protein n=1 Tax=Ditylenchus dipsaci TaxID=166011 RepID=A0A915EIB5_9BILA